MGVALVAVYLLLFVWLIRSRAFFRCPGLSPNAVAGLFLLKFGFGLLLYAVYAYYYAAERHYTDAFRYFDDAGVMFSALREKPSYYFQLLTGIYRDKAALEPYFDKMLFWDRPYSYGTFNDNQTMIRINAVLYLFSFGHYHVHTAFWCFFSMAGLVGLYRTFARWITHGRWLLAAAVFLVPSVLFWGSSVLKEGLLLGGLGLFVYHAINMVHAFTWKRLVWVLALLFFLLVIKTYILMALLPGLLSYVLVARIGTNKPLVVYTVVHVLLAGLALNLHHLTPNYNVVRYIALKQRDFINTSEQHMPGSYFEMGRLEQSAQSILMHVPEGLFNGLLRPLPWDVDGAFTAAASAENIVVLLLFLLCVVAARPIRKMQGNMLLFCASFTFILLVLTGLVTPIAGALVRYKIPAIPFMLAAGLLMLDVQRLPKRLKTLLSIP